MEKRKRKINELEARATKIAQCLSPFSVFITKHLRQADFIKKRGSFIAHSSRAPGV
jgi:hypothetical protein